MKQAIRKITGALAALIATITTLTTPALAQGDTRAIGDEIISGSNFCPNGTVRAAGQLLGIEQYFELFEVFFFAHGGDGRVSFALPDRRYALSDRQGNYLTHCIVTAPFPARSFFGEIIPTSGQCPQGAVPADGRILRISDNQALFSLLGRTYAGDGKETFGLPDLRGQSQSYCVFLQGFFPSRN